MASRRKKKLYWHTTFGKIEVTEPLWRKGTQTQREFSSVAQIRCRSSSQPLQRVMTDFGIDHAFGRVSSKLKEHYGIDMPVSTIQKVTEYHAQRCYEEELERPIPKPTDADGTFVGEMDGSMVPIVEMSPTTKDQRKEKKLVWKEVRLCLVHKVDEVTPKFAGHFTGGVVESGRQMEKCAIAAGFGSKSHLHAVGDGAPWIAEQVEERFGANGSYLVDFYHLCEYLSAASKVCATTNAAIWLEKQKELLKANQAAVVLTALEPFWEKDRDGPVTACHRYISNRLEQLDYQSALARKLPIGSGEIESAHRYVIQERIKLPGAWWKPSNIEAMLALRIKRANNDWNDLWSGVEKRVV